MVMEDGGVTNLSLEVYSCILFKCAPRGSRICLNMADILTKVWPATGEFVVMS